MRTGTNNRYNRIDLNEPLSPQSDLISSNAPEDSIPIMTIPTQDIISHNNNADSDDTANETQDTTSSFVVVVLDALHRKFRVPANPDWTVLQFKEAGSSIHHVEPVSQRLIYMGKMLQDDETLRSSGIDKTETILHLFPKPTLVVTESNTESNNNNATNQSAEDGAENDEERVNPGSSGSTNNNENTGAHIPQIVLDAEEARRSSSMIIFTSSEMFEAQHRVKILSFFLLVISSMELLTLITLLLGGPRRTGAEEDIPPGDPTDSTNPYRTDTDVELREWRTSDIADLVISATGFYVATLGLKATTENTLRTAKRYFIGLVFVGMGWLGYAYYIEVSDGRKQSEEEEEAERTEDDNFNTDNGDEKSQSNTQIYTQALFHISIPVFLWFVCFYRAWQFQKIIREAELEAEERHGRFTRELNRGNENNRTENNASESDVIVTFSHERGQRESSGDLRLNEERAIL